MAEFIGGEEKLINNGEPIVFENNTDSDYEVNMGVIFRKSGLYEVSVIGKRIIISNVPQRKKGKWILDNNCYYETRYICSECKLPFCVETVMMKPSWRFCPNCGCRMECEE